MSTKKSPKKLSLIKLHNVEFDNKELGEDYLFVFEQAITNPPPGGFTGDVQRPLLALSAKFQDYRKLQDDATEEDLEEEVDGDFSGQEAPESDVGTNEVVEVEESLTQIEEGSGENEEEDLDFISITHAELNLLRKALENVRWGILSSEIVDFQDYVNSLG